MLPQYAAAAASPSTTPSPIHKLPVEILTRCFMELAKDNPPHVTKNLLHPDGIRIEVHYGWLIATYVCHRWRSVALNAASLWATPTWVLGARWSEEMLARSKTAPLTIRCDVSECPPAWKSRERLNLAVVDAIADHLHRLKAIDISGILPDGLSFPVMQSLTKPAPLLQELDFEQYWSDEGLILPKDFLGNSSSCIQSLRLGDVASDWTSPLFRELTEVAITARFDGRLNSCDGLYEMLERNARLESLTLGEYLPLSDNHDSSTRRLRPRIALPCLKRLTVAEHAYGCAQILNVIELFADAVINISLSLFESHTHEEDISTMFSALSAHIHPSSHRTLFLEPTEDVLGGTMLTLERHTTEFSPTNLNHLASNEARDWVSIHIHPGYDGIPDEDSDITDVPNATRIMKAALDYMPIIDDVDILVVAPFESEKVPDMWCGLQPLRNVKYLRTSSREIIRHLHLTFFLPMSDDNDTEDSMEPDRDPGYLYPGLKLLEFYKVDFTKDYPVVEESLIAMLRGRRMLGSPLKWLLFTRCRMPDGMVGRLKAAEDGLEVLSPMSDN
ncbi:uncharacterized protein STEHIDRAFT_171993 [Stereum hirsutum FP-91666 SS1]|uniref:uncharacterized protein n=1 Tax=Stereum hirsutum (strain FP-91666) TaxID=721885 RepID=UPI0004449CC0|nr:uncharacterized protein STEHIDRAFT_171993 [Stereum hirsutum FP-91666 SS1]EIM81723.1 hypothetical protein STEHIDRAFT_171993 [Stereum hirsutum FP-91666 SS1]